LEWQAQIEAALERVRAPWRCTAARSWARPRPSCFGNFGS
jgi:hypothetical protein